MGCFQSIPIEPPSDTNDTNDAKDANDTLPEVIVVPQPPPTPRPEPSLLVLPNPAEPVFYVAPLRSMSIKRCISIIKHDELNPSDEIQLIQEGLHYLIQGTRAVVDLDTCSIIGFLDDLNQFHAKRTDHIEEVCKTHGIEFRR